MNIKKELIKRDIAGDVILVPVGKTVLENNGLFVLNEQAAFLWDRLPLAGTGDDLAAALLEEYEVDEATAKADVREFLDALRKLDIIE